LTIAVIGAGMAGAACANALTNQGHKVAVFDKGRSAGGRMSSKRTERGYLDLGAQYFTVRSEAFAARCHTWLDSGSIARWEGRLAIYDAGTVSASPDDTERYIGLPAMQAPVVQLLDNLNLHSGIQIDQLQFDGKHWLLFSAGSCVGSFSQLVLAIPQQQAENLLQPFVSHHAELARLFTATALLPCWAVNIQLAELLWPYDGVFVKNDARLSWLARQSSKQGRCDRENWLLHFTPEFSRRHIDASTTDIAQQALLALQQLAGQDLAGTVSHCHLWRYAQQQADYPVTVALYLPQLALGLAGDWLNGGRVENAWLSGVQLARELRS